MSERKKVLVLMGGWSAEREVSLSSGAGCASALREAGYDVVEHDLTRDVDAFVEALRTEKPDVVFNALHGRWGEDGCVQGLLNLLGIPYTHSGLRASAVAMDKPLAKTLFEAAGIPCAEHQMVSRADVAAGRVMPRPYVVKPAAEGSSVGVFIVRDGDNHDPLMEDDWSTIGEPAMVERFVEGRELTVAVMGEKALAITEITTSRGFYDYEAKYADGGSVHELPARLEPEVAERVLDLAVRAHAALGCRGVSRADFRYDGKNLFILEVNTQPGMTPTSLAPEQAQHAGIPFRDLVTWMVENAEYDR